MPCRNPCRLYIHLAFTYSLRWSLKCSVKRTWTGQLRLSHQWEYLKFNGHGFAVSCVKWPWEMVAFQKSYCSLTLTHSSRVIFKKIQNKYWCLYINFTSCTFCRGASAGEDGTQSRSRVHSHPTCGSSCASPTFLLRTTFKQVQWEIRIQILDDSWLRACLHFWKGHSNTGKIRKL